MKAHVLLTVFSLQLLIFVGGKNWGLPLTCSLFSTYWYWKSVNVIYIYSTLKFYYCMVLVAGRLFGLQLNRRVLVWCEHDVICDGYAGFAGKTCVRLVSEPCETLWFLSTERCIRSSCLHLFGWNSWFNGFVGVDLSCDTQPAEPIDTSHPWHKVVLPLHRTHFLVFAPFGRHESPGREEIDHDRLEHS